MTRSKRIPLFPTIGLCVVLLAMATIPAGAQTLPSNPSQFDMVGYIQAATLNAGCAYSATLCGGTVTVNNQVVTVPANTILQMPATALTWQQVFANAPAPYTGTQTGMALADVPAPLGTYQVEVIGNRVNDQYIAGMVFLAQHSLQSSQGFINFIDLTTGIFEVGGKIGLQGTGQRVKINDPLGKFGRAWTPDSRFTIDENNPTIRTGTGYPMCIPRSTGADALCPQTNRPLDATSPSGFSMIFTTPPVAAGVTPDATLMAPMEVGDFVTYSGILVADAAPATTTYIAAFQVIDNVGIFTTAGTEPSYVAIDVTILGVGGTLQAGLLEATARTRFEGFTTDPSRTIFLWGIDVDPCSGKQTARSWGSIDVDQGPAAGGAALGRWRFRPPNKVLTLPASGAFVPSTREVRAVRSNIDLSANTGDALTAVDAANNGGLLAGQYQAPIFAFLFPENIMVGSPIVPNNFEDMPFLAQGSGPLDGFNGTGPAVGQLDVWPLGFTPQPVKANCAIAGAPVADAGPNQLVFSGAAVTLNGTASVGATGFTWTQTGGPAVVLTGANTATPSFNAPIVNFGSPQTVLNFQLVVTNLGGTASAPAGVTITVNPPATDSVTISLVEYRIAKQRLQVDAASSALPTGTAIMTMQAFDANHKPLGPPQNQPYIGAGVYSVVVVGAVQPASVTVTSDHGGSVSSGITKLRQ